MNNNITESNYAGYKELYMHKKDLICLVVLFVLFEMLAIVSLVPISISLLTAGLTNSSAVLFGLSSQILLLMPVCTIMYDYNQTTKLLKLKYPYMDIKISNHNLKKMLKEYQASYKEQVKVYKVEKNKDNNEEIINRNIYDSRLKYNTISGEVEREKVKVKTLTNKRRI